MLRSVNEQLIPDSFRLCSRLLDFLTPEFIVSLAEKAHAHGQ